MKGLGFSYHNAEKVVVNTLPYISLHQKRWESTRIDVPTLGDSISEGVLTQWKKKVGEWVEEDEIICEIETDKVTVEITCPKAGYLVSVESNEGDDVFVGEAMYTIDPEATSHQSEEAADTAEEIEEDTENILQESTRKETRTKMSKMRQTIGERLKEAQETTASLTTFNDVDMSAAMELRKLYNEEFQKLYDVKLGFMSLFMMASTKALMKSPSVNSSIEGKEMLSRNYADISIAVATPTGLMVPVIRNCNEKSLYQLEKDLANLAVKAREGKIALEDMEGGTFTISNGGVYGSMMGTPILNPPQSAILGMHGIENRPVVRNGNIVIRPMMYLALTYDHRIIDGREAVLFLRDIKNQIEDPRRMLLEI